MPRKPFNVFAKLDEIKQVLQPLIKDKTDQQVKVLLCQCVHYRIGRKNKLEEEERQLYDLLLKNNLAPKTVYQNWLLLEAPEHIQRQLREGKVSVEEARSRSYAYKRMISTTKGKEIIEEILSVIRSLEWKGINTNITNR